MTRSASTPSPAVRGLTGSPVGATGPLEPLVGPLIAVIAAAFYWWAGADQTGTDAFVPLASAFLSGRLSLPEPWPTWIEVVPRPGGGYDVPFPPGPALLVLPLVALLGPTGIDSSGGAAIAGGATAWLLWGLLGRLDLPTHARLALTVAWCLGSEILWAGATGGTHLWAQLCGAAFALGAIRLLVDGRPALLVGLALGAAAACRLPVGAAVVPITAYLADRSGPRTALACLVGAGVVAAGLAAYNLARFGSPIEFGYALITSPDDGHHPTDEWWFAEGLFSLAYLPNGLHTMFVRFFDVVEAPPWLRPNWMGLAVTWTMPALAWIARSSRRDPLVLALAGAAAIVMVPNLLHGNPGFAQWGYRFAIDALPFAWTLLGLVVARCGLSRPLAAALAIGVAVNLYGLVAIWLLGFVGF